MTDVTAAKMEHFEVEDFKDTSHAGHGMTGFDTTEDALPEGYFRSSFFIGTMLAAALGLLAGVAGFGYAAPILGVINAVWKSTARASLVLTSAGHWTTRWSHMDSACLHPYALGLPHPSRTHLRHFWPSVGLRWRQNCGFSW